MFLVLILLVVLGFLSWKEGFSSKDYQLQNEEKYLNYEALHVAYKDYTTILDLKI
jgi:hypothetical protein